MQSSLPPLPPPPKPPWEYTRTERLKQRLLGFPIVVRVLAALVFVAALGGVQALGVFDGGSEEPLDPFLRSEAVDWPDAHEIPMSKAAATEHVDAERVADILGDVRASLIAGRVAWPLGDHDRSGMVRRFAPGGRDWVNEVIDGPDRLALVSEIAAGATVSQTPRVNGLVTYEETEDEEGNLVLRVTSDLTFAYPLVRDGRVTARVVTFHTTTKWDALAEADLDPSMTGLWIADTTWEAFNVDCGYLFEGSLGVSGSYNGVPAPAESSDITGC